MWIFVLVTTLVVLCSPGHIKCANQCSSLCQAHQLQCVVCLATYYQIIDSDSLKCSCMEGFLAFQNYDNTYCCPNGCRSCDLNGCSQCWSYGSIQFNRDLKANVCVCEQNFFMSLDGKCSCLSSAFPALYYWDNLFKQCLVCPVGCVCEKNGCSKCQQITNRNIMTFGQTNSSTCYCGNGFKEFNGLCICPENCNCTRIRNSACAPKSHRFNSTGNWKCIEPYVDTGKACECLHPYQEIVHPNNITVCQCKSMSNPALYYKYQQICYLCFFGCLCDKRGCYLCESPSSISINYNCQCHNNFTETMNGCQCLFPSYFFSIQLSICHCLSDLDNSKYYFSQSDQICRICPQGCRCNENGCYECDINKLRNINKISENQYICQCIQNAHQTLEGICQCNINYKMEDNSSCVCDDFLIPLIFIDDSIGTCVSCPLGCQCDKRGCFRCPSVAFRKIVKKSDGTMTCYCQDNFIQTSNNNFCTCNYNLTFNPQTKLCECVAPSYMNQFNQCVCSSQYDHNQYFYDAQMKTCNFCPYNCQCSQNGCLECHDEAMRVSIFVQSSKTYVCRCTQTAFLIGKYCTRCANNSYYYAGMCVECLNCTSCDSRGCLTCNDTIMYLSDFKCQCLDQTQHNAGGRCLCQDGFHISNDTCVACPLWCAICTDNEVMQCLLCPSDAFRTNSPSRNCECIDGYLEAYPQQIYCCHESCDSCNSTQCLTCPQFSYRQVVNNVCGCIYPFIQINKGACVCEDSYYLLNGRCFKCPQSCKTCIYTPKMSYIQCLSCNEGMNRLLIDGNCSCINGYYESKPIESQYCVLVNCKQQVSNCTSCLFDRVVTNEGCVCPAGKFQNFFRKCQQCNITGCLQCQKYTLCYDCDMNNSYYLSNLRCYYYNNSAISMFGYVGTRRLMIQYQLSLDIQSYIGIGMNMIRVESSDKIENHDPVLLQIQYFNINKNKIMTCVFLNTNSTFSNVLMSLNISYVTNASTTLKSFQQNIHQNIVIGSDVMDNFVPTSATSASFAGTIIFSICAFILYVIGFKHNNILFYIQSLSFMSFVIDQNNVPNIVFLYNLRYSYFNYGGNPFWMFIPLDYIQKCPGNYHITSIDCNIVRNIGLALLIALISLSLILLSRIVHYFVSTYHRINVKFIYYKKFLYRCLQFFFKVTIFPVIYFSIQTLLNTTGYVLIDTNFKEKCIILCSVIIIVYVVHAFIEVYFSVMSKMYKIQNFFQLVGSILMAFIIILSKGNPWLLLAILLLLIKNGLYCVLRTKYMNQSKAFLLMIPSVLSSVLIILVIVSVHRTVLIVIHVITCFVYIIINSILTHWFFMMGKFDKIQQKMTEEIIHLPVVQTQTDLLCTPQSLVSVDEEKIYND